MSATELTCIKTKLHSIEALIEDLLHHQARLCSRLAAFQADPDNPGDQAARRRSPSADQETSCIIQRPLPLSPTGTSVYELISPTQHRPLVGPLLHTVMDPPSPPPSWRSLLWRTWRPIQGTFTVET